MSDKVTKKVKEVAKDEAVRVRALAEDGVKSGAWSYPFRVGVGVTVAMFVFTYLPQVAVMAFVEGPLAPFSTILLVLSESSTLFNFLARGFVLGDSLVDVFDGTLVARDCEPLVAQGRTVKKSGDAMAKLGKLVKKPFERFSPAALIRYFMYLPLNFIPVVGTVAFVLLQGRRYGPATHARYFQLKGYSDTQRKEWVDKRMGAYTGFGVPAVLLEMSAIRPLTGKTEGVGPDAQGCGTEVAAGNCRRIETIRGGRCNLPDRRRSYDTPLSLTLELKLSALDANHGTALQGGRPPSPGGVLCSFVGGSVSTSPSYLGRKPDSRRSGLMPALLLSALAPVSLGAPAPPSVNALLGVDAQGNPVGPAPTIFENKHQRFATALPGEHVIKDFHHLHGNVKVAGKRDIEDRAVQNWPKWWHWPRTTRKPSSVVVTPIKTSTKPVSTSAPATTSKPSSTQASTSKPSSTQASTSKPTSTLVTSTSKTSSSTSSSSTAASSSPAPVRPGKMQTLVYANSLAVPTVQSTQLLGAVTQDPVLQYIQHTNEQVPLLPTNLLGTGINLGLITNYPIYNGSGTLIVNSNSVIAPVTQKPFMSRDNGKGGYLDGYQIFMFADTSALITANNYAFGGFVSTSVAVDKGMAAAKGQPPVLTDMMGTWDNSQALPRGFAPFTTGEDAYTSQSVGKRYGIWPESSLTYLDSQTALCYAALVYIDPTSPTSIQGVGNTLLKITIPSAGGPVATRAVPLMYGAKEIDFGGIGGVRSWGPSGPGGIDGKVYIFGNTFVNYYTCGLFLARVEASQVTNKASYEYFNNNTQTWSPTPPAQGTTAGVFVDGAYSNVDIFYSPRHLTYVMVFQTPFADNNFYWRYLQVPKPIKPTYAGGSEADLAENLHKYKWSPATLLFQAPKPADGLYVYAGGVSMGYFDKDDIVNGGTKMLLQWTAPLAANDPRGYDTGTAVVTFA
ncbi:hypothetical protein FH972_024231 [Carpinus fangiana]|uniref:DUF4185 domain-containing protein n=1 Tax=Carpinus fangiana TaxID=176857 RepID=A0A5N6KXF7_9ROSI|nr:hypothetical protein FH972_024231 [Carpinus fangiana]